MNNLKSSDHFRFVEAEKKLNEMAAIYRRMHEICRLNGRKVDEAIVNDNTESLRIIVEDIGWPTIPKVRREASNAAWLIAYHSNDVALQDKWLELMKACSTKEVSKDCEAYLEDRVLRNHGRLQIYGTEFTVSKDGVLETYPIANPADVERRRREAGLDTLDEHFQRLRSEYPEIKPKMAEKTGT
jgi:hypothetical protein